LYWCHPLPLFPRGRVYSYSLLIITPPWARRTMKTTLKGPRFVRQQLGSHKYTNSCMISNIFAFGAWVFQQFSFPTMANVFCLNGGPARAPICRRVPQDAPQRRPKTPPICPKTPPRRPKKPQEASKTRCRWFLGPQKKDIENIQIPTGFPIFSLSGRWVSNNFRIRLKPTCCPRRPKTSPKHCRTHMDAPRRCQDVQTGE